MFIIGDQVYPISQLFSNIRRNDPYFRLKDGSFFIIPDTFFARYEGIVKFAKSDDLSTWRLSKQYFNLLNETENIHVTSGENMDPEDDFFYHPSPLLKAELRPYQIQGAGWLIRHRKNNLGACLADDMGLGKTLQTIAALVDAKESLSSHGELHQRSIQLDLFGELIEQTRLPLRALIILPASLVYNWHGEIKKYAPSLHVLRYTCHGSKKVSA